MAKIASRSPSHILVLNSGSSSIKCSLYDFSQFADQLLAPIWHTQIDWKNTRVQAASELEKKLRPLLSGKTIHCIGHRIVHGGKTYCNSVRIDAKVKQDIRSIADLAPLHNLADLEGIEALETLFPEALQIAVFDTAFHHTLPECAAIYPGPYEWVQKGIHRFGFHGTSFQYCVRRTKELLGSLPKKMVICHLGSGASLCAVRDGKSIDTTMGFTPLEGLMMDTRSGSVDPGILLYLLGKGKRTAQQLTIELYEKSGLLGLSGISSDMRDVLKQEATGNPRAELAIAVYLHRLVSSIGSMIASLGGLDALVFTAGIGENSPTIRKRACDSFSFLGIELEKAKSEGKGDRILSSSRSKIPVLLIHTQEAFEIARECWTLLTH